MDIVYSLVLLISFLVFLLVECAVSKDTLGIQLNFPTNRNSADGIKVPILTPAITKKTKFFDNIKRQLTYICFLFRKIDSLCFDIMTKICSKIFTRNFLYLS